MPIFLPVTFGYLSKSKLQSNFIEVPLYPTYSLNFMTIIKCYLFMGLRVTDFEDSFVCFFNVFCFFMKCFQELCD